MIDRQWRGSPVTEHEVDSSRIGDYGYKGRPGGVAERDSGRDDCYDSFPATHKGFPHMILWPAWIAHVEVE